MTTHAPTAEDAGGLALRLAPKRLVEAKEIVGVVDAVLRAAVPTLADACVLELEPAADAPRREVRALDASRAAMLRDAMGAADVGEASADATARFAPLEKLGFATFAFAPLSFEGTRHGQLVLARGDTRAFERSALRELGELAHWTALALSHRYAEARALAALRARDAELAEIAHALLQLVGEVSRADARDAIGRACEEMERLVRERLASVATASEATGESRPPDASSEPAGGKPATTFAIQRFRAGTFVAVANDATGRRIVGHAVELARFASASSALAHVRAHVLGLPSPDGAIEVSPQSAAGRFTCDRARAAGRIGGSVVSRDREHMREIGKKGAHARRARTSGPHAIASEPPPGDEASADTSSEP